MGLSPLLGMLAIFGFLEVDLVLGPCCPLPLTGGLGGAATFWFGANTSVSAVTDTGAG